MMFSSLVLTSIYHFEGIFVKSLVLIQIESK